MHAFSNLASFLLYNKIEWRMDSDKKRLSEINQDTIEHKLEGHGTVFRKFHKK